MKDKDSARCDIIKNRARKFAKEYLYWFSSDGASVPYGRSLTYKFAASAFFGALVFADIEAVSWGEIKYTVFNNLRWWFRQSVFSRDNILTVGYSYSNLIMSEDYNSPTSSYWAMMWFILLAVDEKHCFWSAEEKAPLLADLHIQKQAGFLLARPENGRNVLLYSAGQSGLECYGGYRDKYSKFVYSGYFGFSVSRGCESLRTGAFDNTLALSRQGEEYYRTRNRNDILNIGNERIVSFWSPFKGVRIITAVIPADNWHIRIHKISSPEELSGYEGAFSVRAGERDEKQQCCSGDGFAAVLSRWGSSVIIDLLGYDGQLITFCGANTNIMFPRTVLPQLKAKIPIGTTILCSAVYCSTYCADLSSVLSNKPYIDNGYIVTEKKKIKLCLSEDNDLL